MSNSIVSRSSTTRTTRVIVALTATWVLTIGFTAPPAGSATSTPAVTAITPDSGPARPAARAAATDPPAICTDDQQNAGSPPPVGNFEIDGNLCLNDPANLDWANVGGQPVERDGFDDNDGWFGGPGPSASEVNWPWVGVSGNPGAAAQDIGNVYAFTHIVAGHVFTYFGFERDATTGTVGYWLELNKQPNTPTGASPPGPVPNRTIGDLRLGFFQQGSGNTSTINLAQAYRWGVPGPGRACSATLSPPTPCWVPIGAAGFTGAVNQNPVTNLDPPPGGPRTLTPGSFAEVAIDLTTLFGPGNCSGQFGTMNLRSEASLSETSSLGDWIQPIAISVPSTCETSTDTVVHVVSGDNPGIAPNESVPSGSSVFDTATVTGQNGPPGGTVTFNLFSDSSCTTPIAGPLNGNPWPQTGVGLTPVAGTSTSTGDSRQTGPLSPGSYSFNAVYSGIPGQTNDSTSDCEPFTVSPANSSTITVVHVSPSPNGPPWMNTNPAGSSAFDRAIVIGAAGVPAPLGTVTFNLFSDSDCTTPVTTLNGNTWPQTGVGLTPEIGTLSAAESQDTGPLTAGDYGFDAIYSGDANHATSTSDCENFSVAQAASSTVTVVHESPSPDGPVWVDTNPAGSSAFDRATVTGAAGVPAPNGTVTFRLFTGSDCTTPITSPLNGNTWPQTGVPLVPGAGNVSTADSQNTGALTAGNYSFDAIYSGDANNNLSIGDCENFSVAQAASSTVTVVHESPSPDGPVWVDTKPAGSSVFDHATVTGAAGIPAPGGTVTFRLFTDSDCTTPITSPLNDNTWPQTAPVTPGATNTSTADSQDTGPLTAGEYSFDATYNGDANNFASPPSACEPFTVGKAGTETATTLHQNAPPDDPAIAVGSEVPVNTSVFDAATVTATPATLTRTGSVTYRFFHNGDCTGAPATTEDVDIGADGTVPNSAATGLLPAGTFAFDAVYNPPATGANFTTSTSECEPFTVLESSVVGPEAGGTQPPVTVAPPTPSPGILPRTGSDGMLLALGTLCLLSGIGSSVAARRRRRERRSV